MKQIVTVIFIICLVGCFGKEPQKTGKEGKPMPEFSLLLSDSLTTLNTKNLPIGKPIVLFYFSPYCPYCKAQTQELIEEMDELKNIQFYFVSIYSLPELKKFNKIYQMAKYPNILIGQDTAHFIRNYFEIPGVPYLAIYGKDKKLNKAFVGKINSNQLKRIAEE